jgi:hypothetical protein
MPRLLVNEPDFRIVWDVVSGNDVHILEVPDGADALGVERWRTFQTRGNKNLEAIFGYLVRLARQLEDK